MASAIIAAIVALSDHNLALKPPVAAISLPTACNSITQRDEPQATEPKNFDRRNSLGERRATKYFAP